MRTGSWIGSTIAGAAASVPLVDPQDSVVLPRLGSGWLDTMLSTSHAEIALRQSTGSGLPVLFLHGLERTKAVFDRQLGSPLGATFRMIAFDFPGCGSSSQAFAPERTCSLEGYADLALEVLERLGLDQAVVIGWQVGGMVGLELATIFPDLVGLMVIDLPTGERNSEPLRVDTDVSARDPQSALFADGIVPVMQAAAAASVPLALVDGVDDVAVPHAAGLDEAVLWGARRHVLPGGEAPFRERPAPFNELLSVFLEGMNERWRRRLAEPPLSFGA